MSMSYKMELILAVWQKAAIVPGYDPARWRKDACGAWMYWGAYGDRNSAFGWEVDHIVPKSDGGPDDLTNLRPLHHENNSVRLNGPLRCIVTSSGWGNVRL